MKTPIIFISLFMLYINSLCADAIPFIESGKRWHMRTYSSRSLVLSTWGEHPDAEYDLCFKESCDTVIAGNTYQKLSIHNTSVRDGFEALKNVYKEDTVLALLREKDGKVYAYNPQMRREFLLYDFTLDKGDDFSLEAMDGSGRYDCRVDDATYIDINGIVLKRIVFTSRFTDCETNETEAPQVSEWIEGIGGECPIWQPPTGRLDDGGSIDIMPYVTFSDYTFLPKKYDYLHFKGQQLVPGKDITDEVETDKAGIDDLRYEFTDDFKLHVHGLLWTDKSPNQYIHYTLRQREYEPVYDISFSTDVLEPEAGQTRAFLVDFFFDGFLIDPYNDLEFHIHDSAGEHVLIINKQDNTSIQSVYSNKKNDNILYDLSGRRLNTIPERGFHIQNGKKFIK